MTDSVSSSSSTSYLLPGTSNNRMFGLASGLDIDSMVSKLMQAEEIPLDQLKQQQQLLQWKQDDYRSMNSALLDLYNSTFDMTLQSSYMMKTAVSTNTSLVTATASSGAGNTSFSITGGTLASAATIKSATLGSGTDIDPSKSLWENRDKLLNFSYSYNTSSVTDNITVASDGTAKLSNKYIDGSRLASSVTVTDASGGQNSYSVFTDKTSYDNSSDTNKILINTATGDITSNNLAAGSTFQLTYYNGTVNNDMTAKISAADSTGKVVDKSFAFTPDQSLNDILDEINNSGLNVTAFFGSGSNEIAITSNQTGQLNTSGNDITMSGNFFNTNLGFSTTGVKGSDSTLTVNNVQLKSHNNTFTVNNVTFNLNNTFTNTTPVNVNVTNDTSGIFDKITAWVDKYNDTIKTINDKVSEKRNRDYPPLTDTQKKSMSDSDITLWNDKAMSGMLSDDQLLPNGLNQMRMDLYTSVNSVSNTDSDQLADIGITTSSDYTDNGKLVIDEAKLKAAIAADPTSVMNLFTNSGTSSGGTKPDYASEGIMMRLQTTIQNTMNSINDEAGKDTSTWNQFSLGKSIHDYDTQISDMMTHLQDVQNRYYTQFTAMEQAIEQSNQQGAFISQNFGG